MSLNELAIKYNSDKAEDGGSHGYAPYYEQLLASRQVKALLEIGIHKGCSLYMWREFLPDAAIYGIDIDRQWCEPFRDTPGIFVFWSDATRVNPIRGTMFDVIIDDGSHQPGDMIESFILFFPSLRPGGVYVIEDVPPECAEQLAKTTGGKIIEFPDLSCFHDDRLIVIEKEN